MIILDGKKVADEILDNLKHEIIQLGGHPTLAVILVGEEEASLAYIKQKEKAAEHVGIQFQLHQVPVDTSEKVLLALIHTLNHDQAVSGIIVQLPLPSHIRETAVIEAVNPQKDVDGFHPLNLGRLLLGEPCFISSTPAGIIALLRSYKISLQGKRVTIVGRSNIVGKPLSVFLVNQGATVTVCHSETEDIGSIMKSADILIVAVGHPGLVSADMVKDGAVVVDAGWSRKGGKVLGDVDFEGVASKASYITPVPGGVGPMTVATLMQHVVKAYRLLSRYNV